MIIGHFNARGPNNGVEHWFDLIREELIRQGHEVRTFWLRGNQPTSKDINECDFMIYHFCHVANHYKRLGVPFCVVPSSNDFYPNKGEILKQAQSHRNCRFVTYQCQHALDCFNEWGIKEPYIYFPMPARVDLFTRTKPFNPDGYVVAGGRLIPKKGLDKVLPYINNMKVFGDGELKEYLQSLNPTNDFVGWLDGNGLKELFEDCRLYLMPSIVTPDGDREGISNTVKEAMLMELHVIISSSGGNYELKNVVCTDEINGDIVNMEKFRVPNKKGRQEIIDKYSPKVCVDRLLSGIEMYS
jgi:glycosyltransferase involved in cell wall biosynthesis